MLLTLEFPFRLGCLMGVLVPGLASESCTFNLMWLWTRQCYVTKLSDWRKKGGGVFTCQVSYGDEKCQTCWWKVNASSSRKEEEKNGERWRSKNPKRPEREGTLWHEPAWVLKELVSLLCPERKRAKVEKEKVTLPCTTQLWCEFEKRRRIRICKCAEWRRKKERSKLIRH